MAEAYIVDAIRTPIGRKKGSLAHLHPADLGAHPIKALMERSGVDPNAVDDVVWGCCDTIGPQAGDIGRTVWLVAGLPQKQHPIDGGLHCLAGPQVVLVAPLVGLVLRRTLTVLHDECLTLGDQCVQHLNHLVPQLRKSSHGPLHPGLRLRAPAAECGGEFRVALLGIRSLGLEGPVGAVLVEEVRDLKINVLDDAVDGWQHVLA